MTNDEGRGRVGLDAPVAWIVAANMMSKAP